MGAVQLRVEAQEDGVKNPTKHTIGPHRSAGMEKRLGGEDRHAGWEVSILLIVACAYGRRRLADEADVKSGCRSIDAADHRRRARVSISTLGVD